MHEQFLTRTKLNFHTAIKFRIEHKLFDANNRVKPKGNLKLNFYSV